VSWAVTSDASSPEDLSISLIVHDEVQPGREIFNNYGPKPNAEFVLGYGFALPDNPDDTVVLRVGSSASPSSSANGNEVGRHALGAEAVLADVRRLIQASRRESEGWELDLDSTEALLEMVETSLSALPSDETLTSGEGVREQVVKIMRLYVAGQRDIYYDLAEWSRQKVEEATRRAEEAGVSFVDDVDE
jgi:hypothetical protein